MSIFLDIRMIFEPGLIKKQHEISPLAAIETWSHFQHQLHKL